jgi:threonine dehydratase
MRDLSSFSPTRIDFENAARAIADDIIETPLLPLATQGDRRLFGKAENLQPLGSFKIRAGANAVATLLAAHEVKSIATASAGNFAQGLTLGARRRGVSVTVHVPNTAPEVKRNAIAELGAKVVTHDYAAWWEIMRTRDTGTAGEFFVHPFADPEVMIGNGTIALELARQLPECEEIFVPVGGGGLLCGIALGMRALGLKPRIIACEVETAAPLRASFDAGRAVAIERTPSFVDGIGGQSVFEEMWPLFQRLVDDIVVVSLEDVRKAMEGLCRHNRVVAEGAGAAAVAAAQTRSAANQSVAIISGGNIDWRVYSQLLGSTQ